MHACVWYVVCACAVYVCRMYGDGPALLAMQGRANSPRSGTRVPAAVIGRVLSDGELARSLARWNCRLGFATLSQSRLGRAGSKPPRLVFVDRRRARKRLAKRGIQRRGLGKGGGRSRGRDGHRAIKQCWACKYLPLVNGSYRYLAFELRPWGLQLPRTVRLADGRARNRGPLARVTGHRPSSIYLPGER